MIWFWVIRKQCLSDLIIVYFTNVITKASSASIYWMYIATYFAVCEFIQTDSIVQWRGEIDRCFVNARSSVRVYTTLATTPPLFCRLSLWLIENIAYPIDDGIVNFNGTRLMSGESVKCFTYDSIQRLLYLKKKLFALFTFL